MKKEFIAHSVLNPRMKSKQERREASVRKHRHDDPASVRQTPAIRLDGFRARGLMEPSAGKGMPVETLEMIGDGIADILEDFESGRLDHGKMVRPVPAEQKGGAQ